MRKLLCTASLLVFAQTGLSSAQDILAGRQLFEAHCVVCHGLSAKGDGPESGAMAIKPRNLTTLASDNAGVFPTERVVRRIDGREPIVSHGSPMPVYGSYFEGTTAALKTPAGQPVLTSQPIVDLVAYLESLQE